MPSQDYKRSCDLCGYNGPASELTPVGDGKFYCRDDRDLWTAQQTARHGRRRKPFQIKPRKNPRITGEVPLYQTEEAELFNLVLKYSAATEVIGPTGARVGGATIPATMWAECGLYLRELLLEDKRPLSWMTKALAQLKVIGGLLLTWQNASAIDSIGYGGIIDNGGGNPAFPFCAGPAGLVFLALYQFTGEQRYLDGADRVAWFLRQMQKTDLLAVNPTVDSNGTPVAFGGWPSVLYGNGDVSGTFYTAHAYYLWFLARYRDVRGPNRALGSSTASGSFASPPVGTVQQCIDEAVAFYVTGQRPYSSTSSGVCAPLSTSPQFLYQPANANAFTLATSGSYYGMNGCDMAFALRGLYELEGYTARVATIFEWLMGFTSNPAFELTDGAHFTTPLSVVRAGTKGTYDPSVAMADFLALGASQAATPTLQTNGTSFYSSPATALLGPLYNASGRLLRTWKDALVEGRCLTTDPRDVRSPRPYESLGLSYQLAVTSTEDLSMAVIARNALIYRAAPGAFNEVRGLA